MIFTLIAAMSGLGLIQAPTPQDPIKVLVDRLDLERYKATIKGLTQFGDRREGTERNRNAVDWIEAQLKSYGCTNTERLTYQMPPAVPPARTPATQGRSAGGGKARGVRARTGVNNDPMKQPDEKLRELDGEPSKPGPREEVYCTKIGTTHPEEMYIVGAHMDGHGWGEAANDDGSGTALVMELARIFSSPDVQTERSIRFALWNNEETGLNGAYAYVDQRKNLQGLEDPPGSGKYPEPKWLGMIQHDMMLFDHGMPRPDGTISKEQRPEADVNIEFQVNSKMAAQAQVLAWAFEQANEGYATDYPASVGSHMTNTDSTPFQDLVPSISMRENERGTQIGNGWDPQWHQPTDVYATYNDKDFRLGLNAAQTTLAAVARLTGASLSPRVAQAPAPRTYRLEATPSTVAYGYYWSEARPAIRIASGDIVDVDTLLTSTPPALERAGVEQGKIQESLKNIVAEVTGEKRGPGGHILTGPVYVEGAEPGDTLEVKILSIDFAIDYGYNGCSGFLPENCDRSLPLKIISLNKDKMNAELFPGITVPLRPFFGSMGVAPAPEAGRVSSNPPGRHAGNLDNKELVVGSTLYIPVFVPGALFFIGDGHAAQGDGEVDQTAIETSLRGRVQLTVRKGMRLTWPRAETATDFITMAADPDLTNATKLAIQEMVNFLVETKKLTVQQAYQVTSMAGNVAITQLVDKPNVGVHVKIPKSIFQ